jgi:hypothetical protein
VTDPTGGGSDLDARRWVSFERELTRAVDSPCTGPCTDWRPLLAGVGTRSVGSDDADGLFSARRTASRSYAGASSLFKTIGESTADGLACSPTPSPTLQNVTVQSGLPGSAREDAASPARKEATSKADPGQPPGQAPSAPPQSLFFVGVGQISMLGGGSVLSAS